MKIECPPTFKRNFKKMLKKHYDVRKFENVLDDLFNYNAEVSMRKYRDHALWGEWLGYRELHIETDGLLIYRIEENRLILTLVRTGSHDDLF